jgi:hypothetical protein
MAGYTLAGPMCQATRPLIIDQGTMCRAPSPSPAFYSTKSGSSSGSNSLDAAVDALQAEAQNFAVHYLTSAEARAAYVRRIKEMSERILMDVRSGSVSAEQGAAFASRMRNVIMEETRSITSAIARAGAEVAKANPLTLEQAIEKAVQKLFPSKSFESLNPSQKRQVFMEVVEASGRSNKAFTSQIPRWTRLGRGLIVVTVAISAVNIWMARNKAKQGIKEGATLLGGALGGAAANASAGFLCGPGAPVCVTALFIIGGVAGAILADSATDALLGQQEIVTWLGE